MEYLECIFWVSDACFCVHRYARRVLRGGNCKCAQAFRLIEPVIFSELAILMFQQNIVKSGENAHLVKSCMASQINNANTIPCAVASVNV